jgi:thioredoxin-related protein
LGALLTMTAVRSVHAAPVVLPRARSLRDEVMQALKTGHPLLVMVSLDGCPFCKIARENYLGPLLEQGVPMVQIDMRSSSSVVDFEGTASTHDSMARALKIRIAPTILFLGRGGREIAPRLAGGSQSDFYGAYLDERLALAKSVLNAP